MAQLMPLPLTVSCSSKIQIGFAFLVPFRTTRVNRYQKGKTNLDFTEARDSEWRWHQLGHMQVCTSLQTDNHVITPPLSFFTGWMPFLLPNSVEALKAQALKQSIIKQLQKQPLCFINRTMNCCLLAVPCIWSSLSESTL